MKYFYAGAWFIDLSNTVQLLDHPWNRSMVFCLPSASITQQLTSVQGVTKPGPSGRGCKHNLPDRRHNISKSPGRRWNCRTSPIISRKSARPKMSEVGA